MPGPAARCLFLLAVIMLSSWHLDTSRNDNVMSRAAMVAAVTGSGELHIDAHHEQTGDKAWFNGHYYSEKAPLPTLFVIPFWWMFTKAGITVPASGDDIGDVLPALGGFIAGSLSFSFILYWIWLRLHRSANFLPPSIMVILSLMGSFLFVYSGTFFGHLLAALFLLLGWDALRAGGEWRAGLFVSCAVLAEYSLFVFPMIWIVQLAARMRWERLLHLCLGGMPGLLLLLFLNHSITGSAFTWPYSGVTNYADEERWLGLAIPSATAMLSLFFGMYRGLLIFAPVTALCIAVLLQKILHMRRKDLLLHPLLVPVILLVTIISSHSMWWGGWAWGPRHLTSVAVLLFATGLPLVAGDRRLRIPFILLAAAGMFLNLAARNTIWYSAPTYIVDPFHDLVLPQLSALQFTGMQWPVWAGLSPIAATMLFLCILTVMLLLLPRLDRNHTAG